MSRASRLRRASRKRPARRSDMRLVGEPDIACDCPDCAGDVFDEQQLIDSMLGSFRELGSVEDPLPAEMTAAVFEPFMAEGVDPRDFIETFITRLEAAASTESLSLLLAINALAVNRPALAVATSVAAGRLEAKGVQRPRWADELARPAVVDECVQLVDTSTGSVSILAATFRRAGRPHAFIVSIDDSGCGAAAGIDLAHPDELPSMLAHMSDAGNDLGWTLTQRTLSPAQWRGLVEDAMAVRAAHDELEPTLYLPDDDGVPYPMAAVLLRSRMAMMPARKSKRPAAHRHLPDRSTMESIVGQLRGYGHATRPAAKLPAKRKRSAGAAPTFQLKVTLRGARPPIWRRLVVPADLGLADLHDVLQVAFDWQGYHLHLFDTQYGRFGSADADLDIRAESSVTLEQVLSTVDAKMRYEYDFGDSWEHDIVLEKVLDGGLTTPRCTGGRRAAPPEDCGGVWGYAELVDIFGDPTHPEHEHKLDWLGLENAGEFDPSAFYPDEINEALAKLR